MTTIVFKNDEGKVKLSEFLDYLNKTLPKKRGFTQSAPFKFTAMVGKKYVRIVESYNGSRSVYCFLDLEGNILKAASWKAPAKGKRATGWRWGHESRWFQGAEPPAADRGAWTGRHG
jgi:hypothetical protein